jgi:enterochelin esterase-like enzyme
MRRPLRSVAWRACAGFLLAIFAWPTLADDFTVDTWRHDAPGFCAAPIRIRAWLPPDYAASQARYPVVYVNDGQDMEAVRLEPTLRALYAEGAIQRVIVVAVDMPSDRMAAYGFFDRADGAARVAHTRHGPVGTLADAYARWLVETLVPAVDARYRTLARPEARSLLGWSLGGASAFAIGWQYPDVFGRVGAFSPSFWLAADGRNADTVQSSRLAHALVDGSAPGPRPRVFIAVGDAEETDDRDGDGVIDVVDDALDLVQGWRDPQGDAHRGLRDLGLGANLEAGARRTRDPVAVLRLPGARHDQASWTRMLPAFLHWAHAVRAPAIAAEGLIEAWQDVPSRHVAPREVDVWLPPSYDSAPARRYPVLYMHDGQNLFDPALAFGGQEWDVDGAMQRLLARGEVREAIIVGVWNSPRRTAEYMPAVVGGTSVSMGIEGRPPLLVADIASDDYLAFLVGELKPFIDARYRTLQGPADTVVMGSSMGGLVSLYALARYPGVFGAAGAVSTHWPAADGAVVDWLPGHLPAPGGHRLWFDHGTATLDAGYAPYQQRVDAGLRASGWIEGRDWRSRVFVGAAHDEAAWRARVERPLAFLLGRAD